MLSMLTSSLRRTAGGGNRARRAARMRHRLRFESLEERALLAFNVTLSGTVVTFQGSAANDSLTLTVGSGGELVHTISLTGTALESSADLDATTPGVQSLAVDAITGLTVNGGAGTDSVTFGGASPFTMSGITAGCSVSVASENVSISAPTVDVSGGAFTVSGNAFVKTGSGAWSLNGGDLSLQCPSNRVSITGSVTAGSVSITAGTVSISGAVTTTAGDVKITSPGSVSGPVGIVTGSVSLVGGGSATLGPTVEKAASLIAYGQIRVADLSAANGAQASIIVSSKSGSITTTGSPTWQTDGGAVTVSAPNGAISIGTVTAGSATPTGAVSISARGAVGTAALTAATLSLTNTTGSITTGFVTLSNGNLTLTSSRDVTIGGASVSNAGNSGSIDVSASGALAVNGATSTNGGGITVSGAQVTLVGATAGSATTGYGAVSVTSTNSSIGVTGAVSGSEVTIHAATTLTTGASASVTSQSGSIDLKSAGAMTLGANVGVSTTTGGSTASITAAAGTGILTANGALATNGGAVTLSGGSFTNANGAIIRAATTSATTGATGQLKMDFTDSIRIDGAVTAGNVAITAGTTFRTVGTTDTVSAYVGGIQLTAPGGISTAAALSANTRMITQSSSTLSAGTSAIVLRQTVSTLDAIRSYGGSVTLNGGVLTTNGRMNLFESSSRMGRLTINHSGLITVNALVTASSYAVSGGGDMMFAATSAAQLVLNLNVFNPTVLFSQTGGGNLVMPSSNGGIRVDAYGSASLSTTTDYTILTTTGTFVYSASGPSVGSTPSNQRIASVTVQTANQRVITRLK